MNIPALYMNRRFRKNTEGNTSLHEPRKTNRKQEKTRNTCISLPATSPTPAIRRCLGHRPQARTCPKCETLEVLELVCLLKIPILLLWRSPELINVLIKRRVSIIFMTHTCAIWGKSSWRQKGFGSKPLMQTSEGLLNQNTGEKKAKSIAVASKWEHLVSCFFHSEQKNGTWAFPRCVTSTLCLR